MSWHPFQQCIESWGRDLLERDPCTLPLERGPGSQRRYCFSVCVDLQKKKRGKICSLLDRKGESEWEVRVQTGRYMTEDFEDYFFKGSGERILHRVHEGLIFQKS